MENLTSMLIKIPETAFALANSRKSERVMNLPMFLAAGFLTIAVFPKGLAICAEKTKFNIQLVESLQDNPL